MPRLVGRRYPMVGVFHKPQPSNLVPRAGAFSFAQSQNTRCVKCGCTGKHVCNSAPMVMHANRLHTSNGSNTEVTVNGPDEALALLRAGNQRFISGVRLTPNQSLERVKSIAGGQSPFAAFLACADSRVPVEIIFDQGFGDLFITRVAGNVVANEICASLEFGCAVLGAKVLYVLGHTKCGAVSATMAGTPVPGIISSLYYHIQPACDVSHSVDQAVEENVRIQVKQLAVSPVLRELVKVGKLKIVGGVYDLATGMVTELEEVTGRTENQPPVRNKTLI